MSNSAPLTCIVIGEGALAIECAQTLLDYKYQIGIVISRDDAVRKWAEATNVRWTQYSPQVVASMRAESFDYLFSIINYEVLPEELLRLPRKAAINYHDAPLPRYAGLHATTWALIAGEKLHAVSWHRMGPIVDGGDVFNQKEVSISARETAFSLNGKCYGAAIESFAELVAALGQDAIRPVAQDLNRRTYFGKYDRPAGACVLDWSRSAIELDALVRALDFGTFRNPLGMAKVSLGANVYTVSKAAAVSSINTVPPGTVVGIDPGKIRVATVSGDLTIQRISTLDGLPVDLTNIPGTEPIKIGSLLPIIPSDEKERLTEAYRRVCRHEEFWVGRLSDIQPFTLPLSGRLTSIQEAHRWQTVLLKLSPATKHFFEKNRESSKSLFVAAWGAFLARIGNTSNFDIGFRTGDQTAGLERYDHIFASHLPLRIELSPSDDLAILQQSVETEIALLKGHLTYSRDLLLRYPQFRSMSGAPLPVVHSVTVNTGATASSERNTSGSELEFRIGIGADECSIDFDSSVWSVESIQRFSHHFVTFLTGIASQPSLPVARVPLLTDEDRYELLYDFNRAPTQRKSRLGSIKGEATLHGTFEAQAALRPDAVALSCDGELVTYHQLNARSNRLARRLVQNGVQPDTLVGLCLDRSNDLVVALLSILKAGGAYLPIDLAYPAERLAFMLEDAGAPVLLTQRKLARELPSTPVRILFVEDMLAEPETDSEKSNLVSTSGPGNLAYVIYTSGTTGKPKGSMITHRNVVRLFSSTEHWYDFSERDVWSLFHSCAFDFSVWEIWGALLYGGRLVVLPFMVSRSPETVYELLAREGVTVLNQTPSAFRQLIQAEETVGQKPLALRYVIFGGEALEMQSLRPWFERHGDTAPLLINMYGITETTVHVTFRALALSDLNSGSVIGVPIPDLQVYILDPLKEPVPIGVPGEMYVGGAGLARGYLHREDLTAERFIPDLLSGRKDERLYRTGDLARFLPGRDIEYLGRIDHQVKIRGFRIELGEIESVLCLHPAVREATVIVREDTPGSKRLTAYVVSTASVGALREHLRKKVPDYMVPAAFVFLDKLPLTTNGKVDRKALPVPESGRPELAAPFLAPRTDVERKLVEIWTRVLRIEGIGVRDNFFELGGDSILTIQIISLARQAGLRFSPKLLFQCPTIAELAPALLHVEDRTNAEQGVLVGESPLTPIQLWFFEQHLDDSNHYNQSFLFELIETLNPQCLSRALAELERHHDSLRFRYKWNGDSWSQYYAAPQDEYPLEWITLGDDSSKSERERIEGFCSAAQASLDFTSGPLWKVFYFEQNSQKNDRLLFVIHHLAVDGVSWKILVQDLEDIYLHIRSAQPVALPLKTTSYKAWSERLMVWSKSIQSEIPYWRKTSEVPRQTLPLDMDGVPSDNTEGRSKTVKVELSREETSSLLQRVHQAYNTQINDVLLTAVTVGFARWTNGQPLFLNLEGHGREDLFDDIDVTRTVGWFTSIFPTELKLPEGGQLSNPGKALKSVKEQLRNIPRRGIGYSVLRYLNGESDFTRESEPQVLFNYLGQFDQVVDGSMLFRFAEQEMGTWHSKKQRRRHLLEINALVLGGRLELSWTYSENYHKSETVRRLADDCLGDLRGLIAHCLNVESREWTPSDFPLSRLSQTQLDRLAKSNRDLEDLYVLAPMQTLFINAAPAGSSVDQWHCTLHGDLDVPSFQLAWDEVVQRHSILRTTFHVEELRDPVQIVHRNVRLPWTLEDWRNEPDEALKRMWATKLSDDRITELPLKEAPLMRLWLARVRDSEWKFLWSTSALLLDGWSWPLVFRDLSRNYQEHCDAAGQKLEPCRQYRNYLEWLERHPASDAEGFWHEYLKGFREPTPLPVKGDASTSDGDYRGEFSVELSYEATELFQGEVRRLQVTASAAIQAIWAIILQKLSGHRDVVFGAAFAARPTDLPGAETIVGPMVNNLPVRIDVDHDMSVRDFVRAVHKQLLEIAPHQFLSLVEVQRCSEVPWKYRLFDSLIVIQNYVIDEAARRLGERITITEFTDPLHTNHPVMILIEPGTKLTVTVLYDRRFVDQPSAKQWGDNIRTLLEQLPASLDQRVSELGARLVIHPVNAVVVKQRLGVRSQNFVPPQNDMQRIIAGVWQQLFGMENIGIEENFFDLGGHSLLLIQMHRILCETVKMDFSVTVLFQSPTIASLARRLEQPVNDSSNDQVRDRAQRQREALARMRKPPKK